MVGGAFPVAKLTSLLIRQVSKPLAGYVKEGAKRSHVFRNRICLPIAQFYHRCETRYKLWILGLGKPTSVTPLNEQMAVDLGADILGEFIVFLIGGTLLTAEVMRSSAKARAKEEAEERRLDNLERQLIELEASCQEWLFRLENLECRVNVAFVQGQKAKTGADGEQTTTTMTSNEESTSDQPTMPAPPGTRVVTLKRVDIIPRGQETFDFHQNPDGNSKFLPVPCWRRPFTGSASPSMVPGENGSRVPNSVIAVEIPAVAAVRKQTDNNIEARDDGRLNTPGD